MFPNSTTPAVQLVDIFKIYPSGIIANKKINFELKYGEIHALFGENGSGKTTLVKMIFGETTPTSGQIFINGKQIQNHNPQIANSLKMGIVHQHFGLIKNFSVFENLILGYEFKSAKSLQKLEKKYAIKLEKINYWKTEALETKKISSSKILDQYNKKIRKLQIWKEKKAIGFTIGGRKMLAEIQNLNKKFKLGLNMKSYISDLTVTKQQKVEILKVLIKHAKIIIFDEPTSVLESKEIEEFIQSLDAYRKEGRAIVFITHKIEEITKIADRVSVIRKGEIIGTFKLPGVTNEKLISLMVGNQEVFPLTNIKRNPVQKETILQVENLNLKGLHNKKILHNLNFHMQKGEIVGIAGIEDNGQKELLEIIAGIETNFQGNLEFASPSMSFPLHPNFRNNNKKQSWNKLGLQTLKKFGIAYISKNRIEESLLLSEPLYINLSFNDFENSNLFDSGFLHSFQKENARQITKKLIKSHSIKGVPDPDQPASSLSGGNQQKFVIARELWNKPSLLLVNEPTWGIDVYSIGIVYKLFLEHRSAGRSILFASGDLKEIVTLSDRVLVMSRGMIVGEVNPHSKTAYQEIGKLMTERVVI